MAYYLSKDTKDWENLLVYVSSLDIFVRASSLKLPQDARLLWFDPLDGHQTAREDELQWTDNVPGRFPVQVIGRNVFLFQGVFYALR